MILSYVTQKEMYNYITSNKTTGVGYIDSNFSLFITNEIKNISKKLFFRSELYIGKIQISVDSDNRLVRIKNYKCKSNILILNTLHSIKNNTDFTNEEIRKQIGNESIDNYDEVIESGSKLRRKLIKLCKLYFEHKEIELRNKSKSMEEYELAKESFLAEASLGLFTQNEVVNVTKVYRQKQFRSEYKHAQVLKPDIIIIDNRLLIVIDTKVYKEIGIKNHGKFEYCSNANRFQINSYIGKCLDKLMGGNANKIIGIILHIVNEELMEKNHELQGTELTIEKARPIYLYMIQDKGLDYIFKCYNNILKEYLSK